MSILDDIVDELNESFDDLLLDSDLEASDNMECDDKAPAIVTDSDQSDSDLSDDEEAKKTWMDDTQKHNSYVSGSEAQRARDVERKRGISLWLPCDGRLCDTHTAAVGHRPLLTPTTSTSTSPSSKAEEHYHMYAAQALRADNHDQCLATIMLYIIRAFF
ncbi:unnamed protein product [Heligmosomoides polygyrus]|uniref:DDE_Tnp_1_7 domain-containing protein n=1 Tax=Heligmosomoides polygyrus TaxID=6339 RepID=A0A183G861_HELPZ|nr:unnamed protein product [Heligmosomoides polygyrus]